jgi:hypothetical protein
MPYDSDFMPSGGRIRLSRQTSDNFCPIELVEAAPEITVPDLAL